MRNPTIRFITTTLAACFMVTTAQAQTTSFTYQGRLTDGGTAANGNYDLQFTLFDSLSRQRKLHSEHDDATGERQL
jgi:hypothetical protein